MKSLYWWIALVMVITLSGALVVFMAISDRVERKYFDPVFEVMDELELETARDALNAGGPPAVSSYMQRLNESFGATHYLLDANGIDVVSGVSKASLLPPPPFSKSRGKRNGQLIVTHRSADGRYWFVAVDAKQTDRWTFFPYYLLVIGTTGLLCWLAAVGIVLPIRQVTATMERFGQGDLANRLELKRRDEIGGLARSFDEMAERLQKLVVSERRLLQDISHELRSPLARLKFSVKLARTASDLNIALDRVERDVDRLTSLVSEIVEVSRMEGDPPARKNANVVLDELVKETVSDCRVEAEFRGVGIRLEGKVTRAILGDPELLRRAVENVLRNAIRYSPEKTNVDISLDETVGAPTITIRDYGPGVPADSLAQIFEPFFRVEEAREAHTGGIGLGLSIARRAVQLHGGTITAENAFPGLRIQITILR
ncbi:MAG TPA: ATP-binding protein [Candidatus Acidoferrum sp.]|nr:ATP-binding protein [Candidatus Acidoferrum sp.]